MITALGVEALERAAAISRQADIVAAMSLEVLKGTTKAFDAELHKTRPHKGQKLVASRLRSLLHSEVYTKHVHTKVKNLSPPDSVRSSIPRYTRRTLQKVTVSVIVCKTRTRSVVVHRFTESHTIQLNSYEGSSKWR